MEKTNMDIICVGEIVIDFLPSGKEGCYVRKAGGAPANVAIAGARMGSRTAFLGTVGNDSFGKFLIQTLKDNHVEILCNEPVQEAVTTMTFLTYDTEGNSEFSFARKPGADMFLTRYDVKNVDLSQYNILHAGGCSLSKEPAAGSTAYALQRAKEQGLLTSFDINYRPLMWENHQEEAVRAMEKVLPYVDLLKVAQDETEMFTAGTDIFKAMEKYGICVVVETLGKNGARCYWNRKVVHVNGIPAECVDATGAGDAFWGVFLSDISKNHVRKPEDFTEEILERAIRRGNIAGWYSVQRQGAVEALPYKKDIDKHDKRIK